MKEVSKIPLISVIVPVYNAEKYLHRCLNSVINQTYKNLEIICINDGSSDNSLAILKKYAANDTRIKIIDQINAGVSAARNAGLDAATGRYIMFVDSDDFIELNMMEVMCRTLIEFDADIANCQLNYCFASGVIKGRGYSHAPVVKDTKGALLLLLQDAQITNHLVRNIIKKELFDDIRFPAGKIYEDVIVAPQLFIKSQKTVFISDELYHYYSNENSIVHDQSYENKKQSSLAFMQVFDFVEKNMPALVDAYAPKFCKKMIQHHSSILKYHTNDNENFVFAKQIEDKTKRFLSVKFFREHPLVFMRIVWMWIKRNLKTV